MRPSQVHSHIEGVGRLLSGSPYGQLLVLVQVYDLPGRCVTLVHATHAKMPVGVSASARLVTTSGCRPRRESPSRNSRVVAPQRLVGPGLVLGHHEPAVVVAVGTQVVTHRGIDLVALLDR